MNNLNYIYIIPLLIVILISIFLFLNGKEAKFNRKTKFVLIFSVILVLLSSLVVTNYYEKQLEFEKSKLKELLITTKITDSLLNSQELRNLKIDSLKNNNVKLEEILEKIKNQEKVLGNQDQIKNEIKTKIKDNKVNIGEIEKYNEILDKDILKTRKGYTAEESSNFTFNCPKDFESDYLDLKLIFNDEKLISMIDYIYISFAEKTGENRYSSIFDQVYLPQEGVNGFRIKNYFKLYKNKKVDLDVGYFLKSQQGKEYPRFERVVCKNY